MNKIKNIVFGSLLALTVAVFSFSSVMAAACVWDDAALKKHGLATNSDNDHRISCPTTDETVKVYGKSSAACAKWGSLSADPDCGKGDLNVTIQKIINTIIFAIGMIAVVMVILGGVKYSTSQGDSGKVKTAKDTIMYGIIGLVVAILAFAIVNFVLNGVLG